MHGHNSEWKYTFNRYEKISLELTKKKLRFEWNWLIYDENFIFFFCMILEFERAQTVLYMINNLFNRKKLKNKEKKKKTPVEQYRSNDKWNFRVLNYAFPHPPRVISWIEMDLLSNQFNERRSSSFTQWSVIYELNVKNCVLITAFLTSRKKICKGICEGIWKKKSVIPKLLHFPGHKTCILMRMITYNHRNFLIGPLFGCIVVVHSI
jgi:hypothetical protein